MIVKIKHIPDIHDRNVTGIKWSFTCFKFSKGLFLCGINSDQIRKFYANDLQIKRFNVKQLLSKF